MFEGSWFIFGLGILISGKDPRISFKIGGFRLFTRPMPAFKGKGKPVPEGTGRIPGILSSLPGLPGLVIQAVSDLIRHTHLDYLHGNARIGLDDPASTGMLYGFYRAIIALFPSERINFHLVPEFNDVVCEIDFRARIHVTVPFRMIVYAFRIMSRPASRRTMNNMFGKARAKVA